MIPHAPEEKKMPNAVAESEPALDRTMLNEIVHWVNTLKQVGVTPDVAAQVATRFFIAACQASDDEWEEYGEDECDDDE